MGDQIVIGVVLGGVIIGFLLTIFMFIKRFMHICSPNEILIISGKTRQNADGTSVGFRVVTGGRVFQIPILETVDRMDARTQPIEIRVTNAYSKGGIPLTVYAMANVKISTDIRKVNNAIERFLGRNPEEIRRVAKETLEGNLRGVLASLTPEEVNEDRLKFAQALSEEAIEDLGRLGLHLDTLKIQSVFDEVNYLDSIGREQSAIIRKEAEIAESDAKRDAEQIEANCKGRGSVAREQARAKIQSKKNELRQITAELEAEARSEEERTTAAAAAARAQAEQELQEVRTELEKLRLQADVILKAEAERNAREHIAAGEAAFVAERGRAMAKAQQMLVEAWKEADGNGMDIFLIQQVETLIQEVARAVEEVNVKEVALIDSGDGTSLPNYVVAYPRIITQLLAEIRDTLGVDISGSISGRAPRPGGAPSPSADALG
ncbi:MAG: flotillin [Myxococcales bacterium]|nr:flotillin [Myxococcales bacterium]